MFASLAEVMLARCMGWSIEELTHTSDTWADFSVCEASESKQHVLALEFGKVHEPHFMGCCHTLLMSSYAFRKMVPQTEGLPA